MAPDLSWSALAPDLDTIAAAASRAELQAALRPPLSRLNAGLLVTAARHAKEAAPSLEIEFKAAVTPMGARKESALAAATLEASGGRAGPFRLVDAGERGARLRRVLALLGLPDALLLPRFEGRVRSVSLLAGEGLRLEERSTVLTTRILVEAAVASREALEQSARSSVEFLTRRQRDCLDAALRGFNSIQIGAELRLQPKTVDAYIAAAARRLGAGNRVAAVALALQLGLIGAA